MARLTQEMRNKLPDSAFAQPGKRKYPLDTPGRRASAVGFASMHHGKAFAAKIKKSIAAKGYGKGPV
jgi:hypothetical protein